MNKKEYCRIVSGSITNTKTNDNIPLQFGVISDKNGVFYIDFYFSKNEALEFHNNFKNNINIVFESECFSDEGRLLKLKGLFVNESSSDSQKVKFVCEGCIIEINKAIDTEEFISLEEACKANLNYVEIEGLSMEFCDWTTHCKETTHSYDKGLPLRDHTKSHIVYDMTPFGQFFYKQKVNDNLIADFTAKQNHYFTYELFSKFRKDYIQFLSLINGAHINIRKEYFGNWHGGTENITSEIIITYSFEKISNKKYNYYIPLNERLINTPPNILNKLFSKFDKFIEWNNKVDLGSIIFYLNRAEESLDINSSFFIQIIAFERLTTLFAENSGFVDGKMPNATDYEIIKNEFFDLLKIYKSQFGSNYEKARSILGNLNEVKRLSTKDKMFDLINFVSIDCDDKIRNLINIIRNKAIHKGEPSNEGGLTELENLILLNELIQEIILRLIDYDGERYSKILLKK